LQDPVTTEALPEPSRGEGSAPSEDVSLFGPAGAKIFGCLHVPAGDPAGGLVICPPLHSEFIRNYRREVLLGRALAARGIAVLRFHYRGSGHSDGDSRILTCEGMVEDALIAMDRLEQFVPAANISLLGTRVGGIVAAQVARTRPGSPLALWEPALDPSRYFAELFRSRLVGQVRVRSARQSGLSPKEELDERGFIDILGYPIHASLYQSLMRRTLEESLGAEPREILLIQIGGRTMRGPFVALVEKWRGLGSNVTTQLIGSSPEAWWFGAGRPRQEEEPATLGPLRDVTAEWVTSVAVPPGAST
jgi:pimeloyl-ACP methyl ester carboxylesterase